MNHAPVTYREASSPRKILTFAVGIATENACQVLRGFPPPKANAQARRSHTRRATALLTDRKTRHLATAEAPPISRVDQEGSRLVREPASWKVCRRVDGRATRKGVCGREQGEVSGVGARECRSLRRERRRWWRREIREVLRRPSRCPGVGSSVEIRVSFQAFYW
ncbi:uncharacterized protein [Physcomitrium patens]|uniref:uncharacterized protein n=1 Tax=Physcomitrium patens TaxID=3218 RepID=UPI003CCD1552